MELQTIGQISKKYGISIQTLRYYEETGLIQSTRNDDNAYRFYDEAAVKQLQTIIFLRKLRISLKQIKEILNNQNAAATVEIFEQNISELYEEITSLSTIKSILTRFAEELRAKADMVLQLDLLNDANTLSIVDSISLSKNYINNIKENLSMEDLNKANETLNRIHAPKIFTFKAQLDEFFFLGFEQVVTPNTDFGNVWDNFFKISDKVGFGNYERIIWYYKNNEQIFLSGNLLIVQQKYPKDFRW